MARNNINVGQFGTGVANASNPRTRLIKTFREKNIFVVFVLREKNTYIYMRARVRNIMRARVIFFPNYKLHYGSNYIVLIKIRNWLVARLVKINYLFCDSSALLSRSVSHRSNERALARVKTFFRRLFIFLLSRIYHRPFFFLLRLRHISGDRSRRPKHALFVTVDGSINTNTTDWSAPSARTVIIFSPGIAD